MGCNRQRLPYRHHPGAHQSLKQVLTRFLQERLAAGVDGSHRSALQQSVSFLGCAPATLTSEGQNPSRQEKSLLHEDWLILRLRPQLGLQRLDCHAAGNRGAITTAFTNFRINKYTFLSGILPFPALAHASALCGTRLIINNDRHTWQLRENSACTASIAVRCIYLNPKLCRVKLFRTHQIPMQYAEHPHWRVA